MKVKPTKKLENKMSNVEDIIERIKVQGGIEGYVICNKEGQVLRRFPGMSQESAEKYSEKMLMLTEQARGACRDLNPKNELRIMRLQTKSHEIMASYDTDFLVIVIQKWSPASAQNDSNRQAIPGL